MKKLLCLFLFCFVVSCKNNKQEFIYINLEEHISKLSSPDVLYGFDNEYPINLSIRDSLAYIIIRESSPCITILNMNSKQIIHRLGNVGHGPDDIRIPFFMPSMNTSDVLLEDPSMKKMLKIGVNHSKDTFILEKYIDYPDAIFPGGESSISKNYIVGRKVWKGKMFYIYDRNSDSIVETEFYPEMKPFKHDINYIYATTLALNEDKNRIIAGMYLFDIFHIYDLTGNRISTFCFSENPVPHLDSDDLMQDMQKCKVGLICSFATNDYCYFLRINRLIDKTENMLVQINWDGELINAYKIPDYIEGQFYIDEKEGKFYTIRRNEKDEQNEIYEIVAYQLNTNFK